MTPQKSHFQDTKMQKMNSYKGMFPWIVAFTSRKSRILRSQKWRKSIQTKRSTLEQWVTRLGKKKNFHVPRMQKMSLHENKYPWTVRLTSRRNSFFRPPKCGKWVHTNLGILEPWVSRHGKNCIFRAKKWRKSPHPKRGTFQPFVSRLDRNKVFWPPSAGSVCICSFVFRTCRVKQCSHDVVVKRK